MTPVRILRVLAVAGVVAMAAVLVWRLAHQHNGTATAIMVIKTDSARWKAVAEKANIKLD